MDDIDLVTVETHSSVDPLSKLLYDCKGYCLHGTETPTLSTRLIHGGSKFQSTIKALGGVYWVSKTSASKELLTLVTLKPSASGFGAAQFGPVIKAYYAHPSREDVIGVPRFLGISLFGPPLQDLRTKGAPMSHQPVIGLRDLQPRAVSQTLATLEEWGGATIVADCGFGKTRIALAIASRLGRSTLVLCNREVLMLQWAAVVKDLTTWSISWLQGSSDFEKPSIKAGVGLDAPRFLGPSQVADVCIASIDTLTEGTVPRALLQRFGLVIVDEAHHLAAATLVHALPQVPARYVLSLSATPDRRDGLEHALYSLGGPASFVYKRLPSITGITGSVEVLRVEPKGTANEERRYKNGELAFAENINLMAADVVRNTIILDHIVEALKTRRKVIVVSALVSHCEALYEAMSARLGVVTEPKSKRPKLDPAETPLLALMAGSTVQAAEAKAQSTRLVFATYAMLEEGYDDPVLDTLVLATPRSRIQQTVGRIERTFDGKLRPLVIDIADSHSIYPAMWYKRAAFYKTRGFDIHT